MNKKMNLAVNEYKSEYEYVYMVYVKGMLLFNDLRTKVGDDAFFASLKKIQKENRFKNITKNFAKVLRTFQKLIWRSFFPCGLMAGWKYKTTCKIVLKTIVKILNLCII